MHSGEAQLADLLEFDTNADCMMLAGTDAESELIYHSLRISSDANQFTFTPFLVQTCTKHLLGMTLLNWLLLAALQLMMFQV